MYKYISLSRLRAEGVEAGDLDDEKAVALIIRISKQLNVWTGQRFVPLRETLQLDGRGTGLVRVPFFLLERLSLSAQNGYGYARGMDTPAGHEPVQYADWEVPTFPRRESILTGTLNEDQVKSTPWLLESARGVFPEGAQNVQLLAYMGWQEEIRKVETTLTANLDPDAEEAEVGSSTGFRKGCMVVFEVDDEVVHSVILTGVESSPDKLKFDKALDLGETIPSGSKVLSFGFVPEAISTVCAALCVQHRFPLASAESEEATVDRMLIMEKTDNYQYRLNRPNGGDGTSVTGDPYLDGLLDHYTRPRGVGLV